MSAEVETMMYVGDVPWHGLGTYVGDDPVTSKEAIIAAGLDWQVDVKPIYIIHGEESIDGMTRNVPSPIANNKAIVRTTDNNVLGIVGNRYQPIQNVEAFEFMDNLVTDGSMRYHTTGSLREGRRVWLLGKTGSFYVVPGDTVDKYLFLWNSHDGSTALRCLFTTVRVVCANTARAALDSQHRDGIRLHHTKNIKHSMVEAKTVLGFANKEFDNFEMFSKQIVNTQMTTAKLGEFAKGLFPDPPKDIKSKAPEKARGQIIRLFEEGRGNDLPGVKGTAWAAYNALTEYANYYRVSRGDMKQERRFEYTMFGSGVKLINKAQNLLLAA